MDDRSDKKDDTQTALSLGVQSDIMASGQSQIGEDQASVWKAGSMAGIDGSENPESGREEGGRGDFGKVEGISPWRAIRFHWRAFLWCMFITTGALLWGYDAQVSGGTLSIPSFRRDFGYLYIDRNGDEQWVLPARWQSAFNSVSSIGGLFGSLSVGYLADKFGRKKTIAVGCTISIGAVCIQFWTPPHENAMMLVGKLINGVSLGMFVASASGYCSEISPLPLRGITTGSVNLWIVIGQFLSNCVVEGTGSREDRYAYRIPFALQWIFPVILLIGLPFAPESPWYLVRQGRLDSARTVLARLNGSTDGIDYLLQQICHTIKTEDLQAASSSYKDCFTGTNRQRTIIASMVFILQQIAGVVFVLGFSSYFFQLAGFDTRNSFRLGVGVTAIGIVGNLVSLGTVNWFGRRPLFFWGMIGCAVVNLIVGFSSLSTTSAGRWSMASFTIIYNFVYQVGIGPLGYVIFAEVGSAKLRSKTVGIGICVNQICGCVANVVIPYLVNPDEANLGGKVGFIFGGLGLIGAAWTWVFVPETKNRSIDELDALFEARTPPRRFATTEVNATGSGSD